MDIEKPYRKANTRNNLLKKWAFCTDKEPVRLDKMAEPLP